MAVEVKRKKGETFDAMLRRLQGRTQKSGLIREAKRRRFHDGGKNKNQRRESALRRVRVGSKFAYLAKTGQLKEDQQKRQGPRH